LYREKYALGHAYFRLYLLHSLSAIYFIAPLYELASAAMPKTQDESSSVMNKPFGWLGILLIAIISGLVVRVLGDPIVEVTSPKLEGFFEDIEEFFEDPREFFEDSN